MLDINLVPYNLRRKKRKSMLPEGLQIPTEIIFGLGGGFLVLILGVHIFFQLMIFTKFVQRTQYKTALDKISADKTNVDNIVNESRTMQANVKNIEEITKSNNM